LPILKVTRIADQDPAVLRFIESNNLKPRPIEVERHDAAVDAVTLRGKNRPPIIIDGTRAASKRLVEVLGLVAAMLLMFGEPGFAQPASPAPEPSFGITDNSFLLEEAFNQDPGVFQSIFGWTREDTGEWEGSFTQEWPLGGMTHQFSYTIPFSGGSALSTHVDSVVLNYRYQALQEGPRRPAFSPRLGLMLPTGRESDRSDHTGVQVNLPFSKRAGDVYLHGNAGLSWIDGVEIGNGSRTDFTSPFLAASAIWRTTTMFHVMLENVIEWAESIDETGGVVRQRTVTVMPGFRGGWNVGDGQIVLGLAMPIATADADTSVGVLTYFSYEGPFKN
jgi:hypothetical protein